MKTKRKVLNGQILIIIMLALAIISILLVIISRNVRRDTLDQIQAEQYEEYYSAVEQELLKIISGQSVDCGDILNDPSIIECNVLLSNVRPSVDLNNRELKVVKTEERFFDNLVVGKDKSITIDLDNGGNGYTGDLEFGWKGDVAWVINIDYMSAGLEYRTSQSIYDKFSIFNEGPVLNCLNFTDGMSSNTFSFNINQCLARLASERAENPADYTALSVRMKPIMNYDGTAELTLISAGSDLPPQVTVIVATGDFDDDLGNAPGIQLELQVPTKNPSLEILDYALRTNKDLSKPQRP